MTGEEISVITRSPEETFHLGERLSRLLKEGDVVALHGELGSGKTIFTQGVCAGFEIQAYITSPTFTLVQEYPGKQMVFHFDFYRLETIDEIDALDLDGYFLSDGVSIIEWAERGEVLLPEDRFCVRFDRFSHDDNEDFDARKITISAPPNRYLQEAMA